MAIGNGINGLYSVALVSTTDNPGNTLPNYAISIRDGFTGNLTDIFADKEGLIPIAQPGAKTDSNGVFSFYAPNYYYIARANVGGNDFDTPIGLESDADYAGFDAALLAEAGITPSGSADTALVSQRLDAMKSEFQDHAKDINRNPADGSAHNANDIKFASGSLVESVSYASSPNVVDIVIQYGQSNSVGFAQDPDFKTTINPLAFYWNGSAISPLIYEVPFASGDTSTGGDFVAFCNKYCAETGRKVLIVPVAKGETSIAGLSKGTTPYTNMTTYVTNAKAAIASAGDTLGKVFVNFHQGEQDQTLGTTYAAYITLLDQLVSDMKADFSTDKFIIRYVGWPRNRPQQNIQPIINAQRYVATNNVDVVCGFSDAQSFKRSNFTLNSDEVHYSLKALNIMGEATAVVARNLLLDNKAYDVDGDRDMFGLNMMRDRSWNSYYCTLLQEGTDTAWRVSTNSQAVTNDALGNVVSVAAESVAGYSNLLVSLAAPAEDFQEMKVRSKLDVSMAGYEFEAERRDGFTIAIRAFFSGSYLISSTGQLLTGAGAAVSSIVSDLITVTVNAAEHYTISINGSLENMPVIGSFADANSGAATASDPKVRIAGGSVDVYFPAGGYTACTISFTKIPVNIQEIKNLGRIQLYAIGGIGGI